MKTAWPAVVVFIGVFLLVLSILWGFIFPASQNWTEEKSKRLAEMSSQTRQLKFQLSIAKGNPKPGSPSPQEAQAKYDAARQELSQLREEFEGIRDSPKTASSYLLWSGAGMILVGGMAVMAGRDG